MDAYPGTAITPGRDTIRPLTVMALGLRGFPNVQGGIETHAEHLYPLLAALGCRIEVIGRAPYLRCNSTSDWRKIRFHRLWCPRSKGLEAIVHTLLGTLYAAIRRPDILHIHAIGPALLAPLARLCGLRVVVTHHGADYERQKWGRFPRALLRAGERLGMRFAHQRIAISNVIVESVRKKHACESILIHNGVVLPELAASFGAVNQFGLVPQRYVLLVSRIVPEKRHLDLISAFATAQLPGWKLVLVGSADHPDAYIRQVQAAAAGTANVVCTGFQSGIALCELYSHAGVFVLPSSHEGLPIALLEALSFGLPIIASDIPANLEIGLDADSYFPLGDVAALATTLRRLTSEPADAGLRHAQRSWVKKHYDWETIATKTYEAYLQARKN